MICFKKTLGSLLSLLLISEFSQAATYIFVSHSMNDSTLQTYFKAAQRQGAVLVMRGLLNDSFVETKAKCESLKISYNIDPPLFEEYGVTAVPTIVVNEGASIKKVSGHIPLRNALEILREDR